MDDMEKNYQEGFKLVRVISAGRGMNETFKTALKKYNIDSVIIFREKNEGSIANKTIEGEIDRATSEMRKTADNIGITFDIKYVIPNDINDVREKITDIRERNKNVKYFFNLTHGRKVLPLYLLTMSVWMDGTPYYIDKGQGVIGFNIPRMHADEIASNKNFFLILQILYEYSNDGRQWMRYKDVYYEISNKYVSLRGRQGGRQEKLGMGTFSKWVKKLVESHLIAQKFEEGSNKQKAIKLSDDGIFTYKFYKNQFH